MDEREKPHTDIELKYTAEQAEAELCALSSLPVSDVVSSWLLQIRRFPLLSAEQELQLIELAQTGDHEARCLLTNSNLRLVVSIARRYLCKGLSFSDMLQEGNMGLIYSIEKFDPSRGCRFCTYAAHWIRHAITRAIAQQSRSIRLPVYLVEEINAVHKCASALSARLGRKANVDELADAMGLEIDHINSLLCLSEDPISLESPMGRERPLTETLVDSNIEAPANVFEQGERVEELAQAIDNLPPRDRLIIVKRYGLDGDRPHTLAEVASELKVTRQRVKQLEQAIIEKLRKVTDAD